MQQYYYLITLLVSIGGLLTLDYRYRLAFWVSATRTVSCIGAGMILFAIWDALGIWQGIFFKGTSQYMMSIVIAPDFPIEEILFLFLLCYVTLLLYRGIERWQHI